MNNVDSQNSIDKNSLLEKWKADFEQHKSSFESRNGEALGISLNDAPAETETASLLVLALLLHSDDDGNIYQISGAHHRPLRKDELCFNNSSAIDCTAWSAEPRGPPAEEQHQKLLLSQPSHHDVVESPHEEQSVSSTLTPNLTEASVQQEVAPDDSSHITSADNQQQDLLSPIQPIHVQTAPPKTKYTLFPYQVVKIGVTPDEDEEHSNCVNRKMALVTTILSQDKKDDLNASFLTLEEAKKLYKLVTGVEVALPGGPCVLDDGKYITSFLRRSLKVMSAVSSLGLLYFIIRSGIPQADAEKSTEAWSGAVLTEVVEVNAWLFKEISKLLQKFSAIRFAVLSGLRPLCEVAFCCRDEILSFGEANKIMTLADMVHSSQSADMSLAEHDKQIETYWQAAMATAEYDLFELPIPDVHTTTLAVNKDHVSQLRARSLELHSIAAQTTTSCSKGTLASVYDLVVSVAWADDVDFPPIFSEHRAWEARKVNLIEEALERTIYSKEQGDKWENLGFRKVHIKSDQVDTKTEEERSKKEKVSPLTKSLFSKVKSFKKFTGNGNAPQRFAWMTAALSVYFGQDKAIASVLCDVLCSDFPIEFPDHFSHLWKGPTKFVNLKTSFLYDTSEFIFERFLEPLCHLFHAIVGGVEENGVQRHAIAKLRFMGDKLVEDGNTAWFDDLLRRQIAMQILTVYKKCGLCKNKKEGAKDALYEWLSKYQVEKKPRTWEEVIDPDRWTVTVFKVIAIAIESKAITVTLDLEKGVHYVDETNKSTRKMDRTYEPACKLSNFDPILSFKESATLPPLLKDKKSLSDIAITLLEDVAGVCTQFLKFLCECGIKQAQTNIPGGQRKRKRSMLQGSGDRSNKVHKKTKSSPGVASVLPAKRSSPQDNEDGPTTKAHSTKQKPESAQEAHCPVTTTSESDVSLEAVFFHGNTATSTSTPLLDALDHHTTDSSGGPMANGSPVIAPALTASTVRSPVTSDSGQRSRAPETLDSAAESVTASSSPVIALASTERSPESPTTSDRGHASEAREPVDSAPETVSTPNGPKPLDGSSNATSALSTNETLVDDFVVGAPEVPVGVPVQGSKDSSAQPGDVPTANAHDQPEVPSNSGPADASGVSRHFLPRPIFLPTKAELFEVFQRAGIYAIMQEKGLSAKQLCDQIVLLGREQKIHESKISWFLRSSCLADWATIPALLRGDAFLFTKQIRDYY